MTISHIPSPPRKVTHIYICTHMDRQKRVITHFSPPQIYKEALKWPDTKITDAVMQEISRERNILFHPKNPNPKQNKKTQKKQKKTKPQTSKPQTKHPKQFKQHKFALHLLTNSDHFLLIITEWCFICTSQYRGCSMLSYTKLKNSFLNLSMHAGTSTSPLRDLSIYSPG